MSIKRYVANADNTISNAFDSSFLETGRATGSNMGRSDIMEVFSIYGQISSSNTGYSSELARALIKFPIDSIVSDRTSGIIPASGSVSFIMRLYNAEHSQTLPRNYTMSVLPVSRSWEEGDGLDMDNYTDKTYDGYGSNWINSAEGVTWTSVGGDFHATPSYDISIGDVGTEDIELDITDLVEQWIDGTKDNYGVCLKLSSSYEAYFSSSTGADTGSIPHNVNGATRSYYTKRIFARESEFFFKRPCIEARWDDSIKDDRGSFYYSSSLAPAEDNLNTIYLYNYIRGRLRDIPSVGTNSILVSLYSGSSDDSQPSGSKLQLSAGGGVVADADLNVTGGWVSTGIYSASVAITAAATPIPTLYDVWHSGGVEFKTGSLSTSTFDSYEFSGDSRYVINLYNMKKSYTNDETAKFRLFVRNKNWNPNIYTIASQDVDSVVIPSASYKLIRVADNQEIIEHSTGSSDNHTMLSYDVSGNYFNFDMSLLEPGYMYGFKFAFYNEEASSYIEQDKVFKFRVEEDNE